MKEQAHIKGIPKEVILHAIESISKALIADARANYGKEAGFKTSLNIDLKKGTVDTEVNFVPYNYKFRWLVSPEAGGLLVTLVGRSKGVLREILLNTRDKLNGLMETQWAAMLNFSIGFLSGTYYSKYGAKPVGTTKKHIEKAHKKVKKRSKSRHKRTKIDRE